MRQIPVVLWVLGALQIVCGESLADVERIDSDIACTSITGEEIRPLDCDESGIRAAVVIFVTTDCPIANRCAPEIERIRADYQSQGVKMTLVHVDPDLSEKAAVRHAKEYSLKAPVVIDRTHRLVKATGASVTPQAVVIDRSGRICYRGRINDQFADYGTRRNEAQTHDLRDALSAVLEGRPVKTPETEAIGCLIPDLLSGGP